MAIVTGTEIPHSEPDPEKRDPLFDPNRHFQPLQRNTDIDLGPTVNTAHWGEDQRDAIQQMRSFMTERLRASGMNALVYIRHDVPPRSPAERDLRSEWRGKTGGVITALLNGNTDFSLPEEDFPRENAELAELDKGQKKSHGSVPQKTWRNRKGGSGLMIV